MTKLALGTVQFGLDYGIANHQGQTSLEEAAQILKLAEAAGINLLDTAIAYGESEQVLGRLGIAAFKVVTKLPPLPAHLGDAATWAEEQLHGSLQRLGVCSLYGLLMHRSSDLTQESGEALAATLDRFKLKGWVEKIGVSIYNPAELEPVMQALRIDLVQAPLNLVDRRLESSGWLQRLHQERIEVHTRSVFLQGLLLMGRDEIPTRFARWSTLWDVWHESLAQRKTKALEASLSYPMSLPEVCRVVVGVDSAEQLVSLIAVAKTQTTFQDWSFMNTDDLMLINPANWNAL